MQSDEIRSRFLKFFEKRGHKIIPSSSLIPENDPSVLFTTAGMQQFKNYYTNPENAEKDFGTRNVVTVQKCVRTVDIDEVGDETHNTFFEMLGNFSFGGYWKREAITYAYEFITKELGLSIDYVSVLEGGKQTPTDNESREIWESVDSSLTVKNHNHEDNFWGPTGEEGPCGPTTEIYINGVEIWNIVFNEFYKTREGQYKPLKIKGIDTGMGLERLLAVVQKKQSIYDTDLFKSLIEEIEGKSKKKYVRSIRVITDHIRTVVFMIIDGIQPSNSDRGYVLRRLIRRIFIRAVVLELPKKFWVELIKIVLKTYDQAYPKIAEKLDSLVLAIEKEEEKFEKILDFVEVYRLDIEAVKTGVIKKIKNIPIVKDSNIVSGLYIYQNYQTYGVPADLSVDIAKEEGFKVDEEELNVALLEHQQLSRVSSGKKFQGGLANYDEQTIKLHTAHHLLLAGLQAVVDKNIKQRGSNIIEERLRIDFLCDHKLNDEEKKKVEEWVNEKIKMGFNVVRREISLAEAKKIGAEMEFGAKYPDIVSVYFIEDKDGKAISKECCGGPHVSNTKELGNFKILKEEAVSQGIRRIKAALF